jgi:hypothetical protein
MSSMQLAAESHLIHKPARPRRRRARLLRTLKWSLRRVLWAGRLAVSACVLVGVLAALAAVPILNFYVLGYLLETSGRVGRGERWRNVLPWVRYAPRIAAIAFGTAIFSLPLLLLSDAARDAALIDADGGTARLLRLLTIALALVISAHLFFAYARGGTLWSFVRPIKNVRIAFRNARNGVFGIAIAERLRRTWTALAFPRLLWMGLRGMAIALVWLLVPCLLIASAGPADGSRLLLKGAGIALLAVVFPILLILQARFAVENRLWAAFSLRVAFRTFGRAPLPWLTAGLVTAALAVPLFLFKIIAPPRDALWLLTPLFVAAMLPARVVTGWAYRRSAARSVRRNWFTIVGAGAGLFAVGFVYAGSVMIAQFINEHGRQAVFEQHAFSLPVPF